MTGFQLPGELLGLDGVALDSHSVDTVVLEDSEIRVIDQGLGRVAGREIELVDVEALRLTLGTALVARPAARP